MAVSPPPPPPPPPPHAPAKTEHDQNENGCVSTADWAKRLQSEARTLSLVSLETGRFKTEMNSPKVVVIVCNDSSVFPAQSVRQHTPKPNCSLSSSVILSFSTNTRTNRLLAHPRHICRSDRGTGRHRRREEEKEEVTKKEGRRTKYEEEQELRQLSVVPVWHVLPHVHSEHRFPASSSKGRMS